MIIYDVSIKEYLKTHKTRILLIIISNNNTAFVDPKH